MGLGGGGQGHGPQLGVAPLVEVGPLPAAAVRLAGPGAALVQQAAGRGGVEQAEGALGLADPGDVEVLLGPLALAVGLARARPRPASAPPGVARRARSRRVRFGRAPPSARRRAPRRSSPRAAPPSAPPRGPRSPGCAGPSGRTARRPRPAAPGSARRRGTAAGPRPSPRPSRSGRPGPSRSPSGRSSPGRGGSRGSIDRGRGGSTVLICSESATRSGESKAGRSDQQLVERQAQGVEVGPGVPLAAEPLRGHVAERAQDVAGAGQARRRRPWPGRSR